jgi:hypothetical protein
MNVAASFVTLIELYGVAVIENKKPQILSALSSGHPLNCSLLL